MVDLSVNIGQLLLKNPVMTASGTYGYGLEFDDFVDNSRLGGFIVKGTTLEPRQGNNYPRMAETPSGMLNAVGLQNKGVDYFISDIYPKIKHYNTHIFVNVSGSKIEDYVACAEKLNDLHGIPGIELNISCPNVKAGGLAFGTDPEMVYTVVDAVRSYTDKHLIVKLTPNVTDIKSIAKAAEEAGADCLSMINTLSGMVIDINSRRPILARGIGGMSGPAVKPVAVRMVYEAAQVVGIPIIGMGGISKYEDAVEFLLAGASAISVGTANFTNPTVTIEILNGLINYMEQKQIISLDQLIGKIDY